MWCWTQDAKLNGVGDVLYLIWFSQRPCEEITTLIYQVDPQKGAYLRGKAIHQRTHDLDHSTCPYPHTSRLPHYLVPYLIWK